MRVSSSDPPRRRSRRLARVTTGTVGAQTVTARRRRRPSTTGRGLHRGPRGAVSAIPCTPGSIRPRGRHTATTNRRRAVTASAPRTTEAAGSRSCWCGCSPPGLERRDSASPAPTGTRAASRRRRCRSPRANWSVDQPVTLTGVDDAWPTATSPVVAFAVSDPRPVLRGDRRPDVGAVNEGRRRRSIVVVGGPLSTDEGGLAERLHGVCSARADADVIVRWVVRRALEVALPSSLTFTAATGTCPARGR